LTVDLQTDQLHLENEGMTNEGSHGNVVVIANGYGCGNDSGDSHVHGVGISNDCANENENGK
jgi:hypothetical protein